MGRPFGHDRVHPRENAPPPIRDWAEGAMSFFLGVIVGVLVAWVLAGVAFTAWLVYEVYR